MTEYEVAEATLVSDSPWHTSSYSVERGECVEVAEGAITGVRDTKHRDLSALFFGGGEWQAFLDAAKDGFR